jgi:hypothetical protein
MERVITLRTRKDQQALIEFRQGADQVWVPHRLPACSPRWFEVFSSTNGLWRLQRAVSPSEGALFEEALRETLGRSSTYELVDGPDTA